MSITPLDTGARRRAVISSIASNALEFYDNTIYAFLAIYFAGHFFPSHDPLVSQISAFALFGLSYFVRPFGGILVSIYADKIGRKPMIAGLMFAMAFSTGAIGLLPTYEHVGILAPLLLICVRLIQSVAVGGVFSSTTAFLMEFAPPNKRGLFASMQMLAQCFSPILANLVVLTLLYTVGKDAISETWWRAPFLLGFLTAPLGYYIHKFVDESPEFSDHLKNAQEKRKQTNATKLTFRQTLQQRDYVFQILRCIALTMVGTVSFYGVLVYLPNYVQKALSLTDAQRTLIALIAPTFTALSVPLGGMFSDRIARKNMMQIGISCYAIAFFGFFYYLSTGSADFQGALVGFALLGFCMGLHWGVSPIMLSESFPVQIRATAMGISYNVAVVLFGAMTQTYMGLLEKFFGKSPYNALTYIGLSILISLLVCPFWRPASALKIEKT